MALTGLFAKFFGRTVSEGAAFAAGVAIGPVLSPIVREEENAVNARYPFKPVDPGTAAAIAAEDVEQLGWAVTEASYNGVDAARLTAIYNEALNAPGVPQLLTLWRRGEIADADFLHGLRKAKLEGRWDTPLSSLKTERLDPSVVANAIVRGIMRNPGILPVGPPTAEGKVPAFPVSPLDPVQEAEASGIDLERLFVETAIVGRPMSLHEAASAYFRGIIDLADYQRAVAEGDTRNEWSDAILQQARQILTSHDWVELRLRGWIDDGAMYAGTALHGMSKADTDLMFKVLGRPLVHNQVFIGKLRGGEYDGPTGEIDPAYLTSLRQSNMRPEWYNLAWAQRYHFPPFFQTINALNKGWIDKATAIHWLTVQAYDPDAVKTIVDNVAGPSTAPVDKHVSSAQTTTITAIRKAYLGNVLTDNAATAQLERAGLSADAAAGVLAHWQQTKELESLPAPPPAA